jgi:hypothetical protein
MTSIIDDTRDYEAWLGGFTEIHDSDLAAKHIGMASATDPFPFFRATYYRWLRRWTQTCPELDDAPRILAIGDLHVENFGTWRDQEGRLAWGVNDFDEAAELPYTNDLVRLACSVRFARDSGPLRIRLGPACKAIIDGYRETLQQGGHPFVLEEAHPHLRGLAYAQERDPVQFWLRITRLLQEPAVDPPADAKTALKRDLPQKGLKCEFRRRPRVGMGSLGKPRFIAIVDWSGGWVAREAKIITPPASCWLAGEGKPGESHIGEIVKKAIRCHDIFYRPEKRWLVRRLAPRCSRIELAHLGNVADQTAMLSAMGSETANVHLGSAGKIEAVLRDLAKRPAGWLKENSWRMYKALRADWKEWSGSPARSNDDRGG